ncbi:protein kinase domain protein [Ichthyophthirius multifiliis]|uniref:Protein kinase domain protein n=1 Tax=Ichthyophthirius multifiliis TaxID=5932 RepID=G0R3X0_ICHMU|nr:protein kinase domain protein [Ichthyophthirius multifiliis]EGR27846.1 protein kinase domain protein [Ichthyophthirius multifiliis]|eukprot:XP_004027191.1 protein kinase domain protein [Ichthyophthirius multifiliis]
MSSKCFWIKVNKGAPLPNEPVLIDGYFTKKGNFTNARRFFRVYNSFIYYFDEKNTDIAKGYCVIDFDLNFEIVRSKEKKENNALGHPKGIILDKANQKTELASNDENFILKWRDILREKINQRGFHEQYKAIKKIGKGNFASVYLAERLEDNKSFAVKAFSKEAAYSQETGKFLQIIFYLFIYQTKGIFNK